MSRDKLTALIRLEDSPDTLDQVKRMVLFFDHVQYILPEMSPVIKESLIPGKRFEDASLVKRRPDGSMDLSDFNYFRDATKLFQATLGSLNSEVQETILAFEEAGVMSDAFKSRDYNLFKEKDRFDQIRNTVASMDITDSEFIRLSETTPDDFNIFNKLHSVTVTEDNDPEKSFSFLTFEEPRALTDSLELSELLYTSHVYGYCPVFLNTRHREEIRYRYGQFLDGLKIVQDLDAHLVSPAGFPGRFGEVTFNVANAVFSAEAIKRKSAADIIRYRNSMDGSRRKYLSNDLMDLSALVTDNPWGEGLKDEVNKYIVGKLNYDLALLDDEAKRIWDKMFGGLTVRLSEIGRSSAVGGGTLGIFGQLIPNATAWELVVIGAMAGLVKESPKLVQTFVDSLVDFREKKRNAISYLANFK